LVGHWSSLSVTLYLRYNSIVNTVLSQRGYFLQWGSTLFLEDILFNSGGS